MSPNYHTCQELFPFVLVHQCWPSFLEIVNLRNWTGNLLFPPRAQGLLYLANFPSVLLSQRILTIDPLTRRTAVTKQIVQ